MAADDTPPVTSTPDPKTTDTPALASILRPNGQYYRPRKLVVEPWDNDAAYGDYGDIGVFVIGTHDIEAAEPLATARIRREWDSDLVAVHPVRRWVRSAYRGGEPTWVDDEIHGRAAVQFDADYPSEERAS